MHEQQPAWWVMPPHGSGEEVTRHETKNEAMAEARRIAKTNPTFRVVVLRGVVAPEPPAPACTSDRYLIWPLAFEECA